MYKLNNCDDVELETEDEPKLNDFREKVFEKITKENKQIKEGDTSD